MTATSVTPSPTPSTTPSTSPGRTAGPRRTLSDRAAFYLLASIVLFFLASSSAPTPLYAVYAGEWGFSPITTTVVFGIYAIAVLVALLVVGSLSDYIGRRPVLLVAVAVQALTMWVFATAGGVDQLIAARVVQGLATGAAVGAVGAGLLDLDRTRGTVANAVAPMTGTALGGLASGLFVTFLPLPTRLVYLAFFGIFLVQLLGVSVMREPAQTQPGALGALRPEVGVPPHVRGALLSAAPVLFAVWSLAGFYGSLGPALVRGIVGSTALWLGGLALTVLAGSAVVAVLALRQVSPHLVMRIGISALFVGVGLTLAAIALSSTVVFFTGAVIAGAGFGAGMQGSIRTVVPLAAAHERAGLLSVVYVLSYLGMGLPAVIAGWLVVHGGGLVETAREYGVAVMALAAIALALSVIRVRREAALAEGGAAQAVVPCPRAEVSPASMSAR